jgi:arginase
VSVSRLLVPYHLDEYLPDLDVPVDADRTIAMDLPGDDPWWRMAPLYGAVSEAVAGTVREGGRPTVVSGDCTTALGTVAGLQRAGLRPGVVWMDAHGDVQTLETTTSGYLGGLPLRLLTGYRPELIGSAIGLLSVPEDRIVLVDARDLDPPEREYLGRAAIRRVDVTDLARPVWPDGPLYLHLDFDVLDPAGVPGLSIPAAGGPSTATVVEALQRVIAGGQVAAVGLACTWRAGRGAAAAVRDAVEAALGPFALSRR